jgi:hypothetical protein
MFCGWSFFLFLSHALLFSWCNSGVLVMCNGIRALVACGIYLESFDLFFCFLFCVVNPQLIINSFIDIRSNLIIFDFFEFPNRSQLLLLFYYYYNKPTQFLILFSYSN